MMPGKHSPKDPAPDSVPVGRYYELEIIPGLAPFAQSELEGTLGGRVRLLTGAREDRVRFHYTGDARRLLRLQRAVAVHHVYRFDIPRPKALLGHQNLHVLLGLIQEVRNLRPEDHFETFYISAAGSGSSVFARLKSELAVHTGLTYTDDVGDLLMAVRRPQRLPGSRGREPGWEVAVRLSSRPLSARTWRVCDMPGALNATVASTMMSMAGPAPDPRVLNLACGSGTLLIERLTLGPAAAVVGCDLDPHALSCATENLIASGHAPRVTLVRCDAGRVPFPDRWATTVCVDLPFGMLVGSHESNERLYPRLMAEAARVVATGGEMVAITQEVRLFERVVAVQAGQWESLQVVRLKLPADTRSGYIRPRIFRLRRR
jgi:tRNA (guanine6-N2)-methyltransferase